MNSFFAAVFSDRSAAENARRFIEKMHEKNELKILSAVIINKEQDGEVRLKNATTPGALGARLGGVIGGILGLIGGPLVAMAGAAGGALSGGWFDLMRADEREIFLKEVSYKISVGNFALLAEVVDPSDEAKAMVRSHVEECGGSILLKDR
jgi:uncharacterized membrane protein